MKASFTVLMDGDDTLWKTQELYDDVKSKFAYILKESGLVEKDYDVVFELDKIDSCRVHIRGLTTQRFVESMLILYGSLCREKGLSYQASFEREIISISKTIKKSPKLFDDTIEALEILKKRFPLVLFTSGHVASQKRKIASLKFDITKYFEEVRFVSIKNEKRLQKELSIMKLPPSDVCSIGNSLRSDILPAIAVGANAILVERGKWIYDIDVPDIQSKHTQFKRAETLIEAAQLMLNM
jgi:putative hydrolase of the HAD superfamily